MTTASRCCSRPMIPRSWRAPIACSSCTTVYSETRHPCPRSCHDRRMTLADRIPGWRRVRGVFRRETIGKDAVAGSILGIVSVPDGLALGLLAGLNPIAGLYGYLFGMAGAAFFTSSTFMAVQATSAMSIVIADSGLHSLPDPRTAVYTLALLTGVVMIIAGLLRGGRLLRFVPTA